MGILSELELLHKFNNREHYIKLFLFNNNTETNYSKDEYVIKLNLLKFIITNLIMIFYKLYYYDNDSPKNISEFNLIEDYKSFKINLQKSINIIIDEQNNITLNGITYDKNVFFIYVFIYILYDMLSYINTKISNIKEKSYNEKEHKIYYNFINILDDLFRNFNNKMLFLIDILDNGTISETNQNPFKSEPKGGGSDDSEEDYDIMDDL